VAISEPDASWSVTELLDGLSVALNVRTISAGVPEMTAPSAGVDVLNSEWAATPAGSATSHISRVSERAARTRRPTVLTLMVGV
jgi:hypothetical protein